MSLNIYYDESCVPAGMKIIEYNDAYFDANVKLRNTPIVRYLLKEIDDASYVSECTILANKHPNRGALYSEYLSTGCKSALNVVLASAKNNVCISPIEMGRNAWNALLKARTGNVILDYTSITRDLNDTCDIMFDGKHFTVLSDFTRGVYEYENRV